MPSRSMGVTRPAGTTGSPTCWACRVLSRRRAGPRRPAPRSTQDEAPTGVVEHDPAVTHELVGTQQTLEASGADAAEIGGAQELGVEDDAGNGPGAAVHQWDGDDRAHGGLALGQVGPAQRSAAGHAG